MTQPDLNIPAMPSAPSERPAAPAGETVCWAFMGASGGVGVTSLAIQLAYDVIALGKEASQDKPAKVCLIDLDFECGSLDSYLDIPSGVNPDHLNGDAARIDAALVSAFVTKHPSGLDLISAPNCLGGNDKVDADNVLAMMDAVCDIYDVVILDVPRIWRPWTHAAIAAATQFHLVTDLTIPALHTCRARLDEIEAQVSLQSPIEIIMNKYERRALKSTLTAKDAQKAIGRDIAHFICVDAQTTTDALNCGEPAGSMKSDARFVKDVRLIANSLLGNSQEQAPKKKKRGFMSRRAA